MQASVITTSRREFINVPHMLAHAIDFEGAPLIVKIIGGRNIKKSLAVDAFLYAVEHRAGVFHVPALKHMRFEKYPSEADRELVQGWIKHNERSIHVGFTRNLWEQEAFLQEALGPSVLIIPKKHKLSCDKIPQVDLEIGLEYIGRNDEPFLHQWHIRCLSKRMLNNSKIQGVIDRINGISLRRENSVKSPLAIAL